MLKIRMHGNTHIGLVRSINEDSFKEIAARNTIVVCDGMGGHAAGEVASLTAVETIETCLLRDPGTTRPKLPVLSYPELPVEAVDLVQSIRLANRRVFITARSQRSMHGMGTTLVTVRFAGGHVIICHVGDSRAYRFADGSLTSLTTDHSLLAEWKTRGELSDEDERNFPERNIITRALGTRPSVAVDVSIMPARKNDWYMLCSDGLCAYVDDRTIAQVMNQCHPDSERAVQELINVANLAGGQDNVTVAIGVIEETGSATGGAVAAQTIPETADEFAYLEAAFLQELFPPGSIADSPPSEPDTDKIPTLPMISKVPDHQPVESEDKPKRSFWPWSPKPD
ncbi:MAG TPA: PP2C family serine/threonine-protein phosphatase [Gammaproteobacteria bacterium]|nr:PP2C family serine/threonine-protein phosphatase [Gammaproteobacteria bacterium]